MSAALAVIALGLVTGSFLSLAVYRLPLRRSLAAPGSACPACGHRLSAWENTPLLGALLLRGHCRACAQPIGWRYPLLEVATAAVFFAAWRHAGPGWRFVAAAYLLASLVALTATDLERRELPDEITLSGIVVGLAASTAFGNGKGAWIGAVTGGVGLALAGFLYRKWRGRDGMGWGDVKMLAMLGAFLGWQGMLASLLLAAVAGSMGGLALCVVVLFRRRGRWQRRGYASPVAWRRARAAAALYFQLGPLPFGVYLAASGAVIWRYGEPLIRWYLALGS